MGKIVKYCAACEEGFAEKFGFCPNCGAQLTAFELNPVLAAPAEAPKAEPIQTAPPVAPVVEPPVETPQNAVTESFSNFAPPVEPAAETEKFEFSDDVFDEPASEPETFEPAVTSEPAYVPATEKFDENLYQSTFEPRKTEPAKEPVPHYVPDYGYSPTIVVEKNVKQRNLLLLGAFLFGVTLMVGSFIYSVFNKILDIAAIDTPSLLAYVEEVDPTPMEIEPPQKKDDDKGGGGGGGGKDEQTPASKGREAAQVDNPLFAPSVTYTKVTNPDIAIAPATTNKNERKAEDSDMNYGLKNGGDILSDGTGTGGGQGGGNGRGQGNGNGNGIGNGNGNGRGNGNGNGEGDGDGDGIGDLTVKKPSPPPVGPTEPVKILSKPRANYTDSARQAQVQGKVVLRVTFSANGSIGSISVISGLGNGLTEQAIAAARAIRFEPAKRGGVPYSVTKPVEYSFTIY
ncbi:MAG: TonB family protein [Acidobacteria bacterium]|nr:TonB family protein [Acidobacteriota bacterium]